MAVIPQTDFIQGQFAFELKKILVHINNQAPTKEIVSFLRHQESEYLWLFKSTQKGKKFVHKTLANPASRTKKRKLIIIKNSISTGRIILK